MTNAIAPGYSGLEALIHRNVVQFHKNYNNREWQKNGDLVVDDLQVNANGKQVIGRDEFVEHITRFVVPFPDVAISDLDTIVDGNKAAIRFTMRGTHEGDLPTPEGVLHATGRIVQVDGIEFVTFDDAGKFVSLVTVEDLAGLLHQLKEQR